jgi:hypothetical protein
VVLNPTVSSFIKEAGYDTVEKFTQWLATPEAGEKPRLRTNQINIVVTGGSNNNYWSYGGMRVGQSVSIDQWR